MTEPGWKTTEFWLAVLPLVGILVLLGIGRVSVAEIGELWPLLLPAGAYPFSRGIAKRG